MSATRRAYRSNLQPRREVLADGRVVARLYNGAQEAYDRYLENNQPAMSGTARHESSETTAQKAQPTR